MIGALPESSGSSEPEQSKSLVPVLGTIPLSLSDDPLSLKLTIKDSKTIGSKKIECSNNKCICKTNYNIEFIDSDNNTLCHTACMYKCTPLLQKCIEKKMDTNLENKLGLTPLMIACSLYFNEGADILIDYKTTNINYKSIIKCTPSAFLITIQKQNNYLARQLITRECNINDVLLSGNNALTLVIEHWIDDVSMIKLLVEKNINVNIKNMNNETPLYLCLKYKQWANAKYLLEHGADPNQECIDDYPVLFHTIKNKDHIITQTLLEYKANTFLITSKKKTIFDVICNDCDWFIKILLSKGIKIDELLDLLMKTNIHEVRKSNIATTILDVHNRKNINL